MIKRRCEDFWAAGNTLFFYMDGFINVLLYKNLIEA